jgi:hypothetical protein
MTNATSTDTDGDPPAPGSGAFSAKFNLPSTTNRAAESNDKVSSATRNRNTPIRTSKVTVKLVFDVEPTTKAAHLALRAFLAKLLSINRKNDKANIQLVPVSSDGDHVENIEKLGHDITNMNNYVEHLKMTSYSTYTKEIFEFQGVLHLHHDMYFGVMKSLMFQWLRTNKVFFYQGTTGVNLYPFAWLKGVKPEASNVSQLANDIGEACMNAYNSGTAIIPPNVRTKLGASLTRNIFQITANTTNLSSQGIQANVMQLSTSKDHVILAAELIKQSKLNLNVVLSTVQGEALKQELLEHSKPLRKQVVVNIDNWTASMSSRAIKGCVYESLAKIVQCAEGANGEKVFDGMNQIRPSTVAITVKSAHVKQAQGILQEMLTFARAQSHISNKPVLRGSKLQTVIDRTQPQSQQSSQLNVNSFPSLQAHGLPSGPLGQWSRGPPLQVQHPQSLPSYGTQVTVQGEMSTQTSLTNSVATLVEKMDNGFTQMQLMGEAVTKLTAAVSSMTTGFQSLNEKVSQLSSNNLTLHKQVTTMSKTNDDLQSQVAVLSSNVSTLSAQVTVLQQADESHTKAIENLSDSDMTVRRFTDITVQTMFGLIPGCEQAAKSYILEHCNGDKDESDSAAHSVNLLSNDVHTPKRSRAGSASSREVASVQKRKTSHDEDLKLLNKTIVDIKNEAFSPPLSPLQLEDEKSSSASSQPQAYLESPHASPPAKWDQESSPAHTQRLASLDSAPFDYDASQDSSFVKAASAAADAVTAQPTGKKDHQTLLQKVQTNTRGSNVVSPVSSRTRTTNRSSLPPPNSAGGSRD